MHARLLPAPCRPFLLDTSASQESNGAIREALENSGGSELSPGALRIPELLLNRNAHRRVGPELGELLFALDSLEAPAAV